MNSGSEGRTVWTLNFHIQARPSSGIKRSIQQPVCALALAKSHRGQGTGQPFFVYWITTLCGSNEMVGAPGRDCAQGPGWEGTEPIRQHVGLPQGLSCHPQVSLLLVLVFSSVNRKVFIKAPSGSDSKLKIFTSLFLSIEVLVLITLHLLKIIVRTVVRSCTKYKWKISNKKRGHWFLSKEIVSSSGYLMIRNGVLRALEGCEAGPPCEVTVCLLTSRGRKAQNPHHPGQLQHSHSPCCTYSSDVLIFTTMDNEN